MSGKNSLSVKNLPAHPWYVYAVTGHAATFLCSWFLLCRRIFNKGRKKTAILIFSVNLVLFAGSVLLSWYSHKPWYQLLALALAGNLIWSVIPWFAQRLYIGEAPRRYVISEWKTWIEPVCIALIIGIGLSVVHGIFVISSERVAVWTQGSDLRTTKVFLWELFRYIPVYLCYSAVVGIWWAGEGKRFSIVHVLTYLAGMLFFAVCISLLSVLILFLLFHGETHRGVYAWNLMPVSVHGWKLGLNALNSADMTPFVIVPLFIGTVSRFRDFWLRSFIIFPLVSIALYATCFFPPDLWQTYQEEIIHELSDADPGRRTRAYVKLKRMLDRFPNHENRLGLLLRLADFYDEQERFKQADAVYSLVKSESRADSSIRQYAQAALNKPAQGSKTAMINMPMISYTDYMTNNWMVLLRTVHYFTSDELSEEDLLSTLKTISTDKDEIEPAVMPTLAELDDNVRFLGQDCLILPTDRRVTQVLLDNGFPVILPCKHSFLLIRGMAARRDFTIASNYTHVPALLRSNTGEDISREFALLGKKREQKENKEQSIRVDLLSRYLIPGSFWGSPAQKDLAPFMAVVFPPAKAKDLAGIMGTDLQQLKKQSNARLSALIALNAIKTCDPVQAISWARKSNQLAASPLALQIAHLARLLWQSHTFMPLANLPLDRHLPALQKFNDTMNRELETTFMKQAAEQFHSDAQAGKLPWMIRAQYRDFLDRSNPAQRRTLLALAQQDTASDPDDIASRLLQANLYEWQDDQENISRALDAALHVRKPYKYIADKKSKAAENRVAIDLAVLYVNMGLMEKAEEVLAGTDPAVSFTSADYYYCKAAVSNWKGKKRQADALFQKAISIQKYTPDYHLAYARFLVQTGGSPDKARKALEWAIRIDPKGNIQPEAEKLLMEIKGQKTKG